MFNLAIIPRESAAASPYSPAILFDGGRMTYAELNARSDWTAEGSHGRRCTPG
jgi:hypothetical protein